MNVDYSGLVTRTGLGPWFTNIGTLINLLLPTFFYGAGLALLIYLVFGGVQLMLSQGEPKAIEGAKNKITGAVIGFIIIFVAYWLVVLVGKLLGISDTANWKILFPNNF